MLAVDSLDVFYGSIHAVDGASLRVDAGETVALIGSNGAGKSTLLKTISGLMRARAGSIRHAGADITMPRPTGSSGAACRSVPRAAGCSVG